MVNHYNTTQSYLQEIKRFRNWNELNWQGEIENITRLQEEERQITDSNDLINTLKEQQQQAEKKEKELKEQYNQLRDNMGRQKTLIELATTSCRSKKNTISILAERRQGNILPEDRPVTTKQVFYTLHSIDNLKGELIKSLGGTRLNIQKKSESTRDKITKIMREYRYAFPFDALELAEDVEACSEYLKIYHRVVTEGLPAHEARLKAMLNQDTIQKHCHFRQQVRLTCQTDP